MERLGENMKTFICVVECSGFEPDVESAVIELSPEQIKYIEHARETFEQAHNACEEIVDITFYNDDIMFLSKGHLNQDADVNAFRPRYEIVDKTIDELKHLNEVQLSVEYSLMELSELGVRWSCLPKHSENRVYTPVIFWSDFVKQLKG